MEKNDDSDWEVNRFVIKKLLDWSVSEKKQFLINIMRLKYAYDLYYTQKFRDSKTEVDKILTYAKDIDDKWLLVDGHLLESKIIFESRNLAKAKAALTACRANSNLIQIP